MKSYQAFVLALALLLPASVRAQQETPAETTGANDANAASPESESESTTEEPGLEELLNPEVPKTSDVITSGITVGSQSFNPDIAVVGDFVANLGDTNPDLGIDRRDLRNVAEVAFSQHISPSAKAVVKFAYEEEIELEEGYVQFHQLVRDFQFRLGRERVPFLTYNLLDGHELPFINRPLAVARVFGEEGLGEDGLRISYLFPTKTYLDLDLAVYNNRNEVAFNGGATDDRLFFTRLHGYHGGKEGRKETDCMLSYVHGPHDENGHNADILGAQIHYQALPTQSDRQMVNLGYLRGRVETDTGTITRDGYYVHLAKRWNQYHKNEIGLLWEDAASVQPGVTDTIRQLSAYYTWYETERVRLRGQYSHAFMDRGPDTDMVFLQVDYVLGTHPAHD